MTDRHTYAETVLLDLVKDLEFSNNLKILVAGNRSGWLPLEIIKRLTPSASPRLGVMPPNALTAHAFDFHHARAIRDRLTEAGIDPTSIVQCAPNVPEGPYGLAFFMTTPQSMPAELVLDQMEDIHANLVIGGTLYAAFEGDLDAALKTLRLVWSNIHQLYHDKHVTLFRMTKKAELKKRRSFAANWEASVPGGEKMLFTSLPGCFCHRRPDDGGLALAEVASREAKPEDRLLDMGCGCGLVGLLVAQKAGIRDITLIDSHARAIAAAKINAVRAGMDGEEQQADNSKKIRYILADDGLPRGEAGQWDLVVGNPPYYSDYRIAEIFMETAYRALKPGGRCLMVVKTATGLQTLQEKYFRTAEIIKRRGYCVLRSVRV